MNKLSLEGTIDPSKPDFWPPRLARLLLEQLAWSAQKKPGGLLVKKSWVLK